MNGLSLALSVSQVLPSLGYALGSALGSHVISVLHPSLHRILFVSLWSRRSDPDAMILTLIVVLKNALLIRGLSATVTSRYENGVVVVRMRYILKGRRLSELLDAAM